MQLLSDGTVMGQLTGGSSWYRLTPDLNGSYVNGTWSAIAPMKYTRLYYSAAVLTNGMVIVAGAEYGTGTTNSELYNPVSNTWTSVPVPSGLITTNNVPSGTGENSAGFIDSISKILANGDVLVSPVEPVAYGGTALYHASSNSWSAGPVLFRGFYQDEASWVKLPDDSILTIDPFGNNSERYIPSLNKWVNDANVPVTMYSSSLSELGAGFLLPNGRAFVLGGSGNTALYTPSGTTNAGAWTAGPVIPNGLGIQDAPAAMMVNGKILCAVGSTTNYNAPTYFFEYDPVGNSFTQVNGPGGLTTDNVPPYTASMLDLPDGTVLYSHMGSDLYVYQPSGSPLPAGQPAINSVSLNGDGSFTLTGTLLNGISEGAAYGDDEQMNSNYPLVRMTNSSGNVYYARTYNWNSTSVMTSNKVVSTQFAVPAGLPTGVYSLLVSANGNSSAATSFSYPFTALGIVPALGFVSTGYVGGPFSITNENFTLTNTGSGSLNWSLANTSAWLYVSSSNGTLSAGGPAATVTVSLLSTATNMATGNYTATLFFTNLLDNVVQTRQFSLQIQALPEPLQITPATGFGSAGNAGGPFGVTNQNFVLTNVGSVTFGWGLANTSAWMSIFPASGTLVPGGPAAIVAAGLTAAAYALPLGFYTNTVLFTNLQDGVVQSRQFNLAVQVPQLVQNGGFETGDFTDWTESGNFSDSTVVRDTNYVHSGVYGAEVGPVTTLGFISQNLATTAGQLYLLSLWLDNPFGGTGTEFLISWNGANLWDQINLPILAWTNLQFLVTATSANTVLEFGFRDDPEYFGLDDISVMPVPGPAFRSASKVGGNIALAWSALPGVVYQVQYSTNLVQGNWILLGGPITATNGALTALDSLNSDPQRFYRLLLLP